MAFQFRPDAKGAKPSEKPPPMCSNCAGITIPPVRSMKPYLVLSPKPTRNQTMPLEKRLETPETASAFTVNTIAPARLMKCHGPSDFSRTRARPYEKISEA